MQHYDIAIAVNATREINALANYFYFLQADAGGGENRIALRKRSGSEQILLRPGQAVELADPADHWIVSNFTNTGTITGILLAGFGKFTDNRITGTVDIDGVVQVEGAVEINDVVDDACRVIRQASTAALGDTVTDIVTPASNPNGAIVRGLQINCSGAVGGTTQMSLWAAPNSVGLGTGVSKNPAILLGYMRGDNGSGNTTSPVFPARRIPAGWGVYSVCGQTGAIGSGSIDLSIEIL